MTAAHHDLVLAITSHVPHLIAYNIVGTADDFQTVTESEVIKFSAGGFRDFTRIAASDPTMWRDVFLHNKEAVLEILGRFNEDLAALQKMIRWGDGQGLFDLFTRTRAIRRSIIESGPGNRRARFRTATQIDRRDRRQEFDFDACSAKVAGSTPFSTTSPAISMLANPMKRDGIERLYRLRPDRLRLCDCAARRRPAPVASPIEV